MNRTLLVVSVIVAILSILIGIMGIISSFGSQQTPTTTTMTGLPPTSLPYTTTLSSSTSNQTPEMTQSSTTTTTTPSKLQPNALYLLNYTNGTYWFIAVLNVTLPANPVEIIPGSINNNPVYAYQIHEYHLYGYTELVFPLDSTSELMMTKNSVYLIISLSNGEGENFQLMYAGNWTFGSI